MMDRIYVLNLEDNVDGGSYFMGVFGTKEFMLHSARELSQEPLDYSQIPECENCIIDDNGIIQYTFEEILLEDLK